MDFNDLLPGEVMSNWTIKKEFSIGDLLAVGASAIAILGAWYSIDRRLSVVEDRLIQQKTIDAKQDQEHVQLRTETLETLREMRTDIRAIRDTVRK